MARWWFGLTAVAALAGLAIDVVEVAGDESGRFATAGGRIFNLLCFFTIQSNVLVTVACALLAISTARRSEAFAWLRLTGLVAIAITGLVYHALLAGDRVLTGWSYAADLLLHTLVPIAAVLGWLLFGPRTPIARRLVWLTLAFPAAWLALTLVRGPIADFYPYPFVDVDDLGYVHVLANCLAIALLIVGLAAAAKATDERLARRR